MVKILITGSNGFIGRNLKNRLNLKDAEIVSTDKQSLNLLDALSVDALFRQHDHFDAVLHCAVRGANRIVPKEPIMMYENIYAFENLQRYSERINKFICFGSGAEFDMSCYYGLSKYVITNRLKQFENGYNIKSFGTFGEDEYSWRFIKNSITSALKNEPIVITQNRLVNFFYIEDLCKVVQYYIDNKNTPHKDFDVIYSPQTKEKSLLDLAKLIRELCNSNSEIVIERPGFNIPYIGDDSAIKELDIKFVGLYQGIINEILYVRNNL